MTARDPATGRFVSRSPLVSAQVASAAERAIYMAAEYVLQQSRNVVPHEEGTLERSGDVDTGTAGRATVGYNTPYAVVQHEAMDYAHDPGRGPKYLEVPAYLAIPVIKSIVERVLSGAIK